jgi:hypothetical protein
MASGQITEEKRYAINAFLWENFCYIFLPFFEAPGGHTAIRLISLEPV